MATHTVIRDVTETLQTLLENGAVSSSTLQVSVDSPQRLTLTTDHTLNLFLYQVVENAFAKNRPPSPAGGPDQLRRAPLALNLYYMLTPYVLDSVDTTDEHLVLGDAMRVFYDHGLISGDDLSSGLRGSRAQIRLSLCRMNLEEQTRIWNALQMPYRLSVCYEARVLFVASQTRWDADRVRRQEIRYESA